jgi:hypothetical protein
MDGTTPSSAKDDVEIRRIAEDLEIRRAELDEKRAERESEFKEKQAQREADEKRHAKDAELRRLEIDNASGRGIRFTTPQATVAAALIALLSGIVGGVIQAWQSGNAEKIKADGLVAIEANRADASIKIEQRKADAGIELEKVRFVTSLVTKATETPDRGEQIRNLQFYVNAGFIDEPYASKIRSMKTDEFPSSTPPGLNVVSADPATSRLMEIFGPPSQHIGQSCGPLDNDALKSFLVTDKLGSSSVTMLKPAYNSLKAILGQIQKEDPDLLKHVAYQGALCVRSTRGSSALSPHAFGAAIDIQFDEKTPSAEALSNRTAKQAKAAAFFERAGWQWAGLRDYMHFQAALPLIETWINSGELPRVDQ